MTLNLTQSLFKMDETLMSKNNLFGEEFPAFLNQSRISTYYQDNPWSVLTFTNKFSMEPLGGPINYSSKPGYRPGNSITPLPEVQQNFTPTVKPMEKDGLFVPSFMKLWPH